MFATSDRERVSLSIIIVTAIAIVLYGAQAVLAHRGGQGTAVIVAFAMLAAGMSILLLSDVARSDTARFYLAALGMAFVIAGLVAIVVNSYVRWRSAEIRIRRNRQRPD